LILIKDLFGKFTQKWRHTKCNYCVANSSCTSSLDKLTSSHLESLDSLLGNLDSLNDRDSFREDIDNMEEPPNRKPFFDPDDVYKSTFLTNFFLATNEGWRLEKVDQ
jgi:hypothetical protein